MQWIHLPILQYNNKQVFAKVSSDSATHKGRACIIILNITFNFETCYDLLQNAIYLEAITPSLDLYHTQYQ